MALLGNQNDAEEAVQEAFCRLHHPDVAPAVSVRGRFFATLRNYCIDLIRRRKTRKEVSLGQASDRQDSTPSRSLETAEVVCAVENAMGELPADWRQALELRIHGELSYQEIAEIMDSTKNQVRTWLFRGRRQMESNLIACGVLEHHSQPRSSTHE